LLEQAGMVLLAKTNMDEFGMGSHSRNSAFGPVTNGGSARGTADPDALSVGGSSGGSALAVAAKLAHIGIGTDTGGSVRLPAAYMSICGFKPSYGRISRNGVIPYANSLDTVGILSRTADEARRMFDILDQPDNKDPTCLTRDSRIRIMDTKSERRALSTGSSILHNTYGPRTGPPVESTPNSAQKGSRFYVHKQPSTWRRRIGVPLEYNIAEMHPMVRWSWVATLSYLQSQDCEILPISLPSTKHALSAYYILAPAEASSNLAKYDGVRYGEKRSCDSDDDHGQLYARHRYEQFGPEVRRRILLGTYSLSAGAMDNYFIQAQKIRRMVQKDFDSVFRMPNPLRSNAHLVENGVDLIVCPTAPTPPPHIDFLESTTPIESYMNDVFTVPASLAGLPAISVPGPEHPDHPWTPELAVGMQVIGQYGDDYSVLYFAHNVLGRFHQRLKMRNLQPKKRIKF
jgi:aspartyl-tRNA(Asn)/glutamyl-tRNA(Gln) amidotransferase subunit A